VDLIGKMRRWKMGNNSRDSYPYQVAVFSVSNNQMDGC
jgi:hypothetical protein